jgi:hypothetical protein
MQPPWILSSSTISEVADTNWNFELRQRQPVLWNNNPVSCEMFELNQHEQWQLWTKLSSHRCCVFWIDNLKLTKEKRVTLFLDHFGNSVSSYVLSADISVDSACCLLHAGFFLCLLFDPEDGDDMFSETGLILLDYATLYSKRQNSS